MSNIKMKGVFDLPVYVSDRSDKLMKDASHEACGQFDWSKEARAAVHAINVHDTLVDQNSAMKAVLEELTDVAGTQRCQFPNTIDEEIAIEHDKVIERLFEIASEALEVL